MTKRLRLKTSCDCGAGWRETANAIVITPHDIGCAFLKWCAEERQAGYCSTCGSKVTVEREGLIACCPNGCFHQMRDEAALEFFDAAGSGWIRDVLKDTNARRSKTC